MKRNVDIVREILLAASQQGHYEPRNDLAARHVIVLIDLGYLAGWYVEEKKGTPAYIDVMGLTGRGRRLLDAVRNEAVWIQTKRTLGGALDRTPLEGIRATAERLIRNVD